MTKKPKITAVCNGCGRPMGGYEIRISPLMVNALRKMIRADRVKGVNAIHLTKDTKGTDYELSHTEINNITRLRFHGLAAKYYEGTGDDKKRKQGVWVVTRRAAQFIKGEIQIPETVWIFNDRIIERSEYHTTMTEVMGSTPYLDTIEDIRYHEVEKTKDGQMELT